MEYSEVCLLASEFTPLDKSWHIRLGVLDLLHGKLDTEIFLDEQPELSDDLKALARASCQWRYGEPIEVGESGTLYRFLQYAAWARGEDREFIRSGTLADRQITEDPSIVNLPLRQLLELDNGTSQWASAAVLLGSREAIPHDAPYKLRVTYDARDHWNESHHSGERWGGLPDATIRSQARAFITYRKLGGLAFVPHQAEDYCFARAFGLMTPREGEELWPALRGHESDRIAEMETALTQTVIDSHDHRVIQAAVMARCDERLVITNPGSVSKSWPAFWKFLDAVDAY